MSDYFSDLAVWLYAMNRKTLRLRGAYRSLKFLARYLKKLRHYPVQFEGSGIYYANVQDPDTYWLLNAYVGDHHASILHLARLLSAHHKPNAIVWDIGGSMGLFTLEILRTTPEVQQIHVFEPHPVPRSVAEALLAPFQKVTIHPFALGDVEGTAQLHSTLEGTGSSSLKSGQTEGRSMEIPVKTGDFLVEKGLIPAPDTVKIDVEGFEPNVLRGMAKVLAKSQPLIALEILFLTESEIQEITPENYRIRYIRESDGILCEDYKTAVVGGCMDALLEPIGTGRNSQD